MVLFQQILPTAEIFLLVDSNRDMVSLVILLLLLHNLSTYRSLLIYGLFFS